MYQVKFYNSTYRVLCCQTIPPIPKNPHSAPHEHELSFTQEESLLTSQRSSSGPSSPRNAGAGQVRESYVSEVPAVIVIYCTFHYNLMY